MVRFSTKNAAALLCDVPVHSLAAGNSQLLQSSRNTGGLQAESFAHLECNLRLRDCGRHVLIGRNGCGKSTLLRAIASGQLEGWPQDVKTHLVDASELSLELHVLETVLSADTLAHRLRLETADLEEQLAIQMADDAALEAMGERLCELYTELEECDADDEESWRRRACRILQGLGFPESKFEATIDSLSGGWQTRVALAAALFAAPRLLLLDEPTNHLDLPSIEWLERYLTLDFRGTVLCVSHDRSFIEEIATETMIFEDQQLINFVGTLGDFEKQAGQKSRMQDRQMAALERKKAHVKAAARKIEDAADRHQWNQEAHRESNHFGQLGGVTSNGRESKQSSAVSQKLKKLSRLGLERTAEGKRYGAKSQEWAGFAYKSSRIGADDKAESSEEDEVAAALAASRGDLDLNFCFLEPEPLGVGEDVPILELSEVSFCYDDGHDGAASHPVLERVNCSVSCRSRIAIAGRNGGGKSTLLNLITGKLLPTGGSVHRHHRLRVAHLTQHHAEMLRSRTDSAVAYMQGFFTKLKEWDVLEQLSALGIDGSLASLPLSALSGGQRVRVALATLCLEEPHVLILDEPTNHLDIYSIDSLTEALEGFEGCVILVTHNKSLMQKVAKEAYVVEGGSVRLDRELLLS